MSVWWQLAIYLFIGWIFFGVVYRIVYNEEEARSKAGHSFDWFDVVIASVAAGLLWPILIVCLIFFGIGWCLVKLTNWVFIPRLTGHDWHAWISDKWRKVFS